MPTGGIQVAGYIEIALGHLIHVSVATIHLDHVHSPGRKSLKVATVQSMINLENLLCTSDSLSHLLSLSLSHTHTILQTYLHVQL